MESYQAGETAEAVLGGGLFSAGDNFLAVTHAARMEEKRRDLRAGFGHGGPGPSGQSRLPPRGTAG